MVTNGPAPPSSSCLRKTKPHRAASLPYHEQAQGIAARTLSINRGLCKHLDAAVLHALVVWQFSAIALVPHPLKKLAWWAFRPKKCATMSFPHPSCFPKPRACDAWPATRIITSGVAWSVFAPRRHGFRRIANHRRRASLEAAAWPAARKKPGRYPLRRQRGSIGSISSGAYQIGKRWPATCFYAARASLVHRFAPHEVLTKMRNREESA